jgi:small conductance mechanosensitive channel
MSAMDLNKIVEKIIPFVTEWAVTHGLTIIIILITSYLINRFGHIFIEKIIRRAVVPGNLSKEAEEKRENTLISVFDGAFHVLVWIMASLMVLSEFGIDTAPLIAGAGIAGLAFGFGGQYLIRDVIAGLFIILENQYRVGDVVCLDNTCGSVENVTLRMTILRDLDGTVHHVPNGTINKASNLSEVFSRVNLNVGISYGDDLEKVIAVVNRAGEELAADPKFKDSIIKAPQFLRVDNFGDSSVDIKILGDVQPLKQWEVTGELRKRLKIAFDKEGIEIPFPQRVIHQAK